MKAKKHGDNWTRTTPAPENGCYLCGEDHAEEADREDGHPVNWYEPEDTDLKGCIICSICWTLYEELVQKVREKRNRLRKEQAQGELIGVSDDR